MKKKKTAKLLDELKQIESKVMDFDNIKNDDKTLNIILARHMYIYSSGCYLFSNLMLN